MHLPQTISQVTNSIQVNLPTQRQACPDRFLILLSVERTSRAFFGLQQSLQLPAVPQRKHVFLPGAKRDFKERSKSSALGKLSTRFGKLYSTISAKGIHADSPGARLCPSPPTSSSVDHHHPMRCRVRGKRSKALNFLRIVGMEHHWSAYYGRCRQQRSRAVEHYSVNTGQEESKTYDEEKSGQNHDKHNLS